MSAYARPTSVDEALELLLERRRRRARGRHRSRRADRPRASPLPRCSSTSRTRASAASSATATVSGSAPRRRCPTSRPTRSSPRTRSLATAASLAASPLLRNQGTVGGNLCQHTRCWYYRGEEWTCWLGGGDTCFAQIGDHRKHNLEAGDCISAHPSDLAPALAVCGATVVVRSLDGEREIPLLDLYRRPTDDNRSLVTLAHGELVVAVRLPAPPDASVYLRTGERQAFSFPLVSVAAARRGDSLTLAAAGVANIPRALDPADPLAGLPGPSAERLEAEGARDARRAGLSRRL